MAKKKAPKKQMKGDVGKGTGGKARSAIREKVKKGATLEDIAKATNRNPSTISAVLGARIKNPPAGLAEQVSKTKTPKKKPEGKIPKGTKSTAAFRKHRK